MWSHRVPGMAMLKLVYLSASSLKHSAATGTSTKVPTGVEALVNTAVREYSYCEWRGSSLKLLLTLLLHPERSTGARRDLVQLRLCKC